MVSSRDIFQENLTAIIGPHKFRYTENKQLQSGTIEAAWIEGQLTNLADYIKANLTDGGFKFVSHADISSVRKNEITRNQIFLIKIQTEEALIKFKELIFNFKLDSENDKRNILKL